MERETLLKKIRLQKVPPEKTDPQRTVAQKTLPALKPEIKQGDLFLCDLSDAALKDDMASMEHPVFTISKKPDMKARYYEHNGHSLRVSPSEWGIATMYDKDILIFATSKLMEAKNRGEPLSKRIVFEAQEALRFMHRTDKNGNAGGTQFRALEQSLRRLTGTRLETDIKTGDMVQKELFGLLDAATIYRQHKDGRVLEWGVRLSDWLFNAILGNEVLTLHPDYFRLRKPIEKRVYELARRHCGGQPQWIISLELLLKKTGANSNKREFKRLLNGVVKNDHLPDYHIAIDTDNNVIFTHKEHSKVGKLSSHKAKLGHEEITVDSLDHFLDLSAQKKGSELARQKGIDYYYLKGEFADFLNKKGVPDNISAAFLSFIKQKKIV